MQQIQKICPSWALLDIFFDITVQLWSHNAQKPTKKVKKRKICKNWHQIGHVTADGNGQKLLSKVTVRLYYSTDQALGSVIDDR